MLHYQVVRTSPGGATLSNKMNNTVHYGHVRHTLALMCAKNHLLIFSSFLDIWENVEWPRFFWTTLYMKFVFFRFRRTEKIDSVVKGLMGQCSPQNFWARSPATCNQKNVFFSKQDLKESTLFPNDFDDDRLPEMAIFGRPPKPAIISGCRSLSQYPGLALSSSSSWSTTPDLLLKFRRCMA